MVRNSGMSSTSSFSLHVKLTAKSLLLIKNKWEPYIETWSVETEMCPQDWITRKIFYSCSFKKFISRLHVLPDIPLRFTQYTFLDLQAVFNTSSRHMTKAKIFVLNKMSWRRLEVALWRQRQKKNVFWVTCK